MMRRAALPGLVLAALTVSTPIAVAQTVDPQVVQVDTVVVCGAVTVTLTNPDTGGYGFTWTVGPFDGGPAGESGRIDVAAGATVTETVTLPEDSFAGRGFFTLGVAYGPNTHRQVFVDLGLVDTDCADPVTATPTPDPTPTPVPTSVPSTVAPTTPAPVAPADVDCADLTDAQARELLAADPSDPHVLDIDGDGEPCESDDEGDFDQVGEVPVGGVATGA